MRIFSSHLLGDAPPVLVPEGFSLGAACFGWLYLLWRRAWVAAALNLALAVACLVLARQTGSVAPLLGLAALQGLFGHDLWRWGLERRGYAAGPIVAAADQDAAFARLMGERRDLFATSGPAAL